MDEREKAIFEKLKAEPETAHVPADWSEVYTLHPRKPGMLIFRGEFMNMTDEAILAVCQHMYEMEFYKFIPAEEGD